MPGAPESQQSNTSRFPIALISHLGREILGSPAALVAGRPAGILCRMPDPVEQRAPWRGFRRLAFPALWLAIIGFFALLHENLAPFIGAVLIAYLLAPFVRNLCRVSIRGRHLPRWGAVLLIYAVLAGVVTFYTAVAVPRVGHEIAKLAEKGNTFLQSLTPEKIDDYTVQVREWLQDKGLPVRLVTPRLPDEDAGRGAAFELDLEQVVRRTVSDLTTEFRTSFIDFLKLGPRFAAKLVRNVLLTFLILMVAGFLLANPQRVIRFVRSLFPERLHEGFDEVIGEIDTGLAGVVRGQVLIAMLNGGLTLIGTLLLGVEFPVLLSSLTAVLSLIPIFGSFLSAIPIVAVGLTDGLGTGFGIMLWLIGINLSEANFFNPKIIGDQAKIHPALVVFVLLAGERLYGVVGALFAVPLLSVGLSFFKVLHRRAIAWNREIYGGRAAAWADPRSVVLGQPAGAQPGSPGDQPASEPRPGEPAAGEGADPAGRDDSGEDEA